MDEGPRTDVMRQIHAREFNEWISDTSTRLGEHGPMDAYRCECGDPRCSEAIDLTVVEYESVRGESARFLVARDHEDPQTGSVVCERERFSVVQIVDGTARIASHADPRR